MNDIENKIHTVKRLENSIKNCTTERQRAPLEAGLITAKARLTKAQYANIQQSKLDENKKKLENDFGWKNVRRSSLEPEEKVKIMKEYGMSAYLSMPI